VTVVRIQCFGLGLRGDASRQWDEALMEDEAKAMSSSWLYGTEACMARRCDNIGHRRGGIVEGKKRRQCQLG
jgi:hypothetical protein